MSSPRTPPHSPRRPGTARTSTGDQGPLDTSLIDVFATSSTIEDLTAPRAPTGEASPGQAGSEIASARVAAEIVTGHFTHHENTEAFSTAAIDAILDAVLREGKLTPAPVERSPLPGETLLAAARRGRELDELRAHAWSPSTLSTYGSGVMAWRAWCAQQHAPALPFAPALVTAHLLDYAFERTETGHLARDEHGMLRARVSTSSVALRLASLNKAASFLGLPPPGDNQGVIEAVRGIRRAIGVAPVNRKAALDMAGITACLNAAEGYSWRHTRDHTIALLRARTGATAGQLARLSWADVELLDNEVELTLPRRHNHGTTSRVSIVKHRNPRLCLHTWLTRLRKITLAATPRLGRVFAHRDGAPLTRQAPYSIINRVFAHEGGFTAVPTLSERSLSRALRSDSPGGDLSLLATRDRALLLAGFYTASRRANLSALNWRDLTDFGDMEGWRIVHRRSKTDQEGLGRNLWLPATEGPHTNLCPTRALRAWREAVIAAAGRAPHEDEPVFVSLSSSGTLAFTVRGRMRRLRGDSVNDVIQRLTVAAGLAPQTGRNPYGSHSLRAGFVTESLRDDKLTIDEVADVTGHASLDVLYGYKREANLARTSPSRKLIQSLLSGSD